MRPRYHGKVEGPANQASLYGRMYKSPSLPPFLPPLSFLSFFSKHSNQKASFSFPPPFFFPFTFFPT